MPKDITKQHGVNYKLALAKSICQTLTNSKGMSSASAETEACAAAAADFQHPLRGVQGGE